MRSVSTRTAGVDLCVSARCVCTGSGALAVDLFLADPLGLNRTGMSGSIVASEA